MARPQRDFEPEDAMLIEGGQVEDISQIKDDQKDLENEILAELGAADHEESILVKVYRIPEKGRELIDCFEVPGEQFNTIIARCRNDHHGGKFTARIYKNAKLYRAIRFAVETPRVPPSQIAAPAPADTALAAAVQQQGAILQALVQQLAQMKQVPVAAAPAVDMVGMMTGIAGLMSAMQGMMPKAPDPMGLISAVVNLARDANTDGREKGMWDIVSDFLNSPLVANLQLAPANGATAPNGQPPRQLVGQTPPPSQPSAPINQPRPSQIQVPPQATTPEVQELQNNLAVLCSRAQKHSDPALYADVIEDFMTPADLAMLLAQADPVIALTALYPPVAHYREWFSTVLNILREPRDAPNDDGNVPIERADQHPTADNPQRHGGGADNIGLYGPIREAGESEPDYQDQSN